MDLGATRRFERSRLDVRRCFCVDLEPGGESGGESGDETQGGEASQAREVEEVRFRLRFDWASKMISVDALDGRADLCAPAVEEWIGKMQRESVGAKLTERSFRDAGAQLFSLLVQMHRRGAFPETPEVEIFWDEPQPERIPPKMWLLK